MKHATTRFWIAVGGLVLLAVLVFPAPALAHGPSTGGADANDIRRLFNITLAIAIPVFLLVEGLILFAIIRYRRRHANEIPEQVEGNHTLEIAWTVLAFAIVGVLFILTLRALQTDYTVEAERGENVPDLTVHVEGYLFNWDYTYFLDDGEPTGVKATKKLTIPAGKAVLLEITSRDVQHSFWVPDLGGKVDAIPGYTNTMWLQVAEPGLYKGNCAEYCGLNHYNMLIEVEVLPPAEFDAWLSGQMATANVFVPVGTDLDITLPEGDAARGEQIFGELACTACHLPETDQPSGPSIARMMRDAATREGYTADEYLHESIVLPCAVLAEGYTQCIMPQDYGNRLDAQGLADLIEYLKTY